MSMFKFVALLPGIFAFGGSSVIAQTSQKNMRYFVQDATATPEVGGTKVDDKAPTGLIGDVQKVDPEAVAVDSEATTEATAEEEDDANSSDALRGKRSQGAEFFVDYSTFVTDQEDFSPLAYGLRYWHFQDRDLKLGASLAVERFQWNDDESDVVQGTQLRKRNIDVEGSAVRFGVHAQYFVENSLNAQLSLFGSAGKTEKDAGSDSQFYGRSGLTVNLGNQWSWEDFTLSWNWLSLTYNTTAKIGSTNLLKEYPSNRSGGMVLLAGLGFGAEW